jgi:hypothetical protein
VFSNHSAIVHCTMVPTATFCGVLLLALSIPVSGTADALNDQICMDDAWAAAGNLQLLQCTATDIEIIEVIELNVLDDGCAYPGDTVEMQTRLRVISLADLRYDIGLWISQDGYSALNGSCTVASLPLDLDLDGTSNDPDGTIQDTCGDMAQSAIDVNIELVVACVDAGDDGFLDITYCSSWRQDGANDLCVSPLDAFPAAPSKCNCATLAFPILIGQAEPDGIFESGFESE